MQADLNVILPEIVISVFAVAALVMAAYTGKDKMAGILMSTGTPGSEGTLGGLVHQGRRIHNHLTAALNLGRLCSSDPVCASQTPGTDNRHLEGAACHGCLYIAECSCEWFNRYLDRALVVPVLGQPGALAFFDGAKNGLL